MATDHPFYMFSLADVWQWLINMPVVFLVLLGLLLAFLFMLWDKD